MKDAPTQFSAEPLPPTRREADEQDGWARHLDYLQRRVASIRCSIAGGQEDLIRESRARIVEAATRLFRRQGFQRTLIRDIARELGVSQGHIYQYISQKEDIIVLLLDSAVDDYRANLFPIPAREGDPAAKLSAAIRAYYRILDRHHAKTSVLYTQLVNVGVEDRKIFDMVEVEVTNLFRGLVQDGIDAGRFRRVDAFLMAFNIVSLGHMWALKRNRFRNRMTVDDYIREQTACLMSILGAVEGQR